MKRTTFPMSRLVGLAALAALAALAVPAAGPGCKRQAKNLPLFAACDSDPDCASEICAFKQRSDRQGYCTKPCEEDKDCPEGKACTAIVEHSGESVLACGEPAPINLPAMEGMPGMPPPRMPPSKAPGGTSPGTPGTAAPPAPGN